MENLRKALSRAAVPTTIVGAVFGFIGDVLQPLLDLAPIVAVLSFIGAIAALVWFIGLRRQTGNDAWDSLAGGLFIFFIASTIIFTVLTIFFAFGPPRGYLADNVGAIAKLQTDVLGIKEDVGQIKQTTQATQQQIVAIATTQAQGFADLQRSFAQLQAGQGNLVSNPQTPQEWYSNARLYQLRGDNANALKAYEGYFKFNLEYVDPYTEYVALLKASDGIARARQTIDDFRNARRDSHVLELVAVRLLDSTAERIQRLTALTTRAPQFGPAFTDLGQEYSRALNETPTQDLIDKQRAAFTAAFKLEEQQQGVTRFYIDKALADKELTAARQVMEQWASWGKVLSQNDVMVIPNYDGYSFAIILPEAATAQKLLVSIDDPQPKLDLGKGFGGKGVNTSIPKTVLPVGEHTLYYQYVDANGATSRVFSKKFRVDPIAILYQQQPPDLATNTFTASFIVGVLNAKDGEMWTFKYGVNSRTLDQQALGTTQTAVFVKGLKAGTHTLFIQATEAGGKQTPVVEYPFSIK
jgi:tetratricopeptide (TPR) repeat protein